MKSATPDQIAPFASKRLGKPYFQSCKEGREARKCGRPRVNPYVKVPALSAFVQGWFDGWDAMDDVKKAAGGTHGG